VFEPVSDAMASTALSDTSAVESSPSPPPPKLTFCRKISLHSLVVVAADARQIASRGQSGAGAFSVEGLAETSGFAGQIRF
jgi:hypothetical protein